MTKSERMEILECALELLEDWLGAECDPECECILHPLRLLIDEEANR